MKFQISEKASVSFFSGFTLLVMLYVFEAFQIDQGLSASGHSLWFRALAFGILTSTIFSIFEFGFKDRFLTSKSRWNRRMLWWSLEVYILHGFLFLLYNWFWHFEEWTWWAYFLLLSEIAFVQFPVLVLVYLFFNRKAPKEANADATLPEKLTFVSENGKQAIQVLADHFLYAQSQDNYVQVYFLQDGALKSELFRSTLKKLERQFEGSPFLKRAHRGFLVNPTKVIQMKKKNQKQSLSLGANIEIPVSASYLDNWTIQAST